MAEIPREIKVRLKADTTQFEAALRSAAEVNARVGRLLKVAPSPWQPRSWYATSERAS